MPFKCARPEDRAGAARSSSSAAASAFYDEGQSANYTTQANAAIQKDLTRHALELLRFGVTPSQSQLLADNDDSKVSNSTTDADMWILLDLGAGSGLSTLAANEWLLERGLLGFTLAFDISASMLSLTAAADNTIGTAKDNDAAHAAQYDALCMQRAGFYRGNAAQRFPLRDHVFHAAIGISMLQWLTREGLETCFASLHRQLGGDSSSTSNTGNTCGGRAVFQVYPPTTEYVELMEQTAREMGFAYAEVFVSFPHATTAKKWYFCIEKNTKLATQDQGSGRHHTEAATASGPLCLFGRRFHRRCAWHLLRSSSSQTDSVVAGLRDRLGKEHVKTAWHIWRKYRRSLVVASSAQVVTHAKAKRSLELWKSDEVIGKALQSRFLPENQGQTQEEREQAAKAATYELFLSHMDEIVDILHALVARSSAPEISSADVSSGVVIDQFTSGKIHEEAANLGANQHSIVPAAQTFSPMSPSEVVKSQWLLRVVIESLQDKKERPNRSDDETRILDQLLQFHAGKSLNFLSLEFFSVLALVVRCFVSKSNVEPLLASWKHGLTVIVACDSRWCLEQTSAQEDAIAHCITGGESRGDVQSQS